MKGSTTSHLIGLFIWSIYGTVCAVALLGPEQPGRHMPDMMRPVCWAVVACFYIIAALSAIEYTIARFYESQPAAKEPK